jgi:hypothetical protein
MRILKHSLLISILGLVLFNSCKNDLELNAPYKEVPSVYALLNPYEKQQMIRINKVFLGVGDANQMAKVSDSVNYQPGELTVTLERYVNGQRVTANAKKDTIAIVFTESVVTTVDGPFTTTQRVYITSDSLFHDGEYLLRIRNNHTGNEFTSRASPILQVASNQGYGVLVPPYRPYPSGYNGTEFIDYSAPTATVSVKPLYFKPVDRGKIYQVVIRTHYYNDLGSTTTFDNVDFIFDDPKSTKIFSGVTYINVTFKSGDYYANMGLGLSRKIPDGALGRKVFMIEYIIHASTQEYVDWIEFAKPSLSLNQNKPLYSNFTDHAALGIFTFRSSVYIQKEPSTVFVNSFSRNASTCQYKFYDSNNNILGCK